MNINHIGAGDRVSPTLLLLPRPLSVQSSPDFHPVRTTAIKSYVMRLLFNNSMYFLSFETKRAFRLGHAV